MGNKRGLLVLVLGVVLAGPALAETVQVTIRGVVEFNQIGDPPLGDAQPDDDAVLTFVVDSDLFEDNASFPTRGYEIDESSFSLDLGTTVIGLQDPFPATETPFFVLRNDDPAVDGFFVSTDLDGPIGVPIGQEGAFGQFRNNFSVTYSGDTLASLNILDALGTYDFDGLSVFNWTVDDGPFNALGIVFTDMTLEPAAVGEAFIEDFEDFVNEAGWVVNAAQDFIDPQGGHPDAFLHTPIVSFAPSPRTTVGIESVFTGDYRARGVISVGIDLKTFSNSAPGPITWPLSVVLSGDSGTPGQGDDCFAFFIGARPVPPEEVPCETSHDPCDGWHDFEFEIPSQSPTLPPGWQIIDVNGCESTDATWNEIITSVNQLNFHYGDPQFPAPDISWNIGLDNPRIVVNPTAPPSPPGVPDGEDGPPLIVQKIPIGDSLRLTFDTTTCPGNVGHHVIFGFGSQLPDLLGGTMVPAGSSCGVGSSPFNWVDVPDPSSDVTRLLWFLVLANDGVDLEGSWGHDHASGERQGPGPEGSSGECGILAKDLANVCGQ